METPPKVSEDMRLRIVDAYKVCQDCGLLYGAGISANQKQRTVSTWTGNDICDICELVAYVTEFRDFGYHNPYYNTHTDDL